MRRARIKDASYERFVVLVFITVFVAGFLAGSLVVGLAVTR